MGVVGEEVREVCGERCVHKAREEEEREGRRGDIVEILHWIGR